jgi:hypothetical protein
MPASEELARMPRKSSFIYCKLSSRKTLNNPAEIITPNERVKPMSNEVKGQ